MSSAKRRRFKLYKWNHFKSPLVIKKALIEAVRGQGDSSTRWYGCRVKLDIYLYKYDI